jgi:ribosomal protein S18 acetylase RimI-like enzyme
VDRDGTTPTAAPPDLGGTALEFRRLGPEIEEGLAGLFDALEASGDSRFFHPHPLTRQEARSRCAYRGADLYYAAVHGEQVLGYGMLRGWDEGFAVPSLGVAVAPGHRGLGLGRLFMAFLHAAARLRGARSIRLKVYEANAVARSLYEGLGYRFESLSGGELLGLLDLER